EDVQSSGERRGHRRYEDREPAVVEFFDDEPRDERLLYFDECRPPRFLVSVSRQSLCQAAHQGVAGKFLEERDLEALSKRAPRSSSHGDTDDETERQHQ